MATQNYGRSYKIVFGRPEYVTDDYYFEGSIVTNVPPASIRSTAITLDTTTIPAGDIVQMSNLESEGDSIRGFNFQLNSTRTSNSSNSTSSEKSTINLYNLNPSTLAVLQQEGVVMQVYAGYQGKANLIYTGDLISVIPKSQGNDIVYTCLCKDGVIDTKNTKVSLQYDESLSVADIIKDLIQRFPTSTVGTLATSKQEDTYITGGFSCQGKLINIFDKLCKSNGLTYNRFNGKISVKPDQLVQGSSDYVTAERNTYTLNADVIKTLDPIIDNKDKLTAQTNIKRGIQVTTYLIPISLDQFITIPPDASQQYAGTYKLTAINYNLDSRKGPWDVTLKCEPM